MRKILKKVALVVSIKLLNTRLGRMFFLALPVPFNSLRSKRVNILKEGRRRTINSQEVAAFDREILAEMARIKKVGVAYIPAHSSDGDLEAGHINHVSVSGELAVSKVLEEVGEILAQDRPEVAAKHYGKIIEGGKPLIIARMVLSKLHSNFVFKPAIFEILKQNILKSSHIDLLKAALETAPDLKSALDVLQLRGTVSAAPDGLAIGNIFRSTVFDAIFVDNGIDLAIAEILQRRFLPDSQVFIGNRAIVSKEFDDAASERVASWIPVIESNSAYYTLGERELDQEFQEWWENLTPAINGLFSQKGSALLSPKRGQTFSFLLKDKIYLHYRELWSWRYAIQSWARQHGQSCRGLALSNRPQLFSTIAKEFCEEDDDNALYFWSPTNQFLTSVSEALSNRPGSAQLLASNLLLRAGSKNTMLDRSLSGSSFVGRSSEDLAKHFQLNVFGKSKLRQYTIITTSATRVYSEFALKLADKLGYDNCLIVDNYLKNKIFAEKCEELDVGYANAYSSPNYNQISSWEQDLTDSLLGRVVEAITKADNILSHEITCLLMDSSILHNTLVNYLRTVECIILMEQLIESSEVDNLKLIFCPGRLPLSLALANHEAIHSSEIQFFWNSDSFRYQRPKSDEVYVIDTVEQKMISSRFKGIKPVLLGSPAIDIKLRSNLFEVNRDNVKLSPLGPWKVALPLQPLDSKNYIQIIDELVSLCAEDPRFHIFIKPHPHNSHALIHILMARIPNALRGFFTVTNEDPYKVIMACDIMVGFSSNMLIEAAALRKGVFQIRRDFVEKYMEPRNIAITVEETDVSKAIRHYTQNVDNQRDLQTAQEAYFKANPGMDPLSSFDIYQSFAKDTTL